MSALTDEQRAIVGHRGDVHLLVRAVPGSGKTTTLAHRVAALVAEGAHPASIQVLMFNRAVQETFRARLAALGLPPSVRVHTFDALAFRLLRRAEARGLTRRLHMDEEQGGPRRRIIEVHRRFRDRVDDAEDIERAIAFWKAQLVPPARARCPANPALVEAYAAFEALRTSAEEVALGLGDLAYTAVGVLRRSGSPEPPPAHLFVDEFQDVNPARVELLQRLAGPETRMVVVGDEDQGINEWAGADARFFRDFASLFPTRPTICLPLTRSFRLGPGLAAAANALISHNPDRSPATVVGAGSAPGRIEICGDLGAGLRRLLADGVEPPCLAVLYRSRAEGVRALSALARARLPVQTEDTELLRRGPGPDLLRLILRAALEDRLERPDQLWLLARAGVDYVKGEPFKAGLAAHRGGVRAYLEDRRGHRRAGQLDRVVDGLAGMVGALDRVRAAPDVAVAMQRVEEAFDAEQVLRSKGRSERAQEQAVASYEALADWLGAQRFPVAEVEERLAALDLRQGLPTSACVWASTVHKAKGLEWPVVLVAGVADGAFPAEAVGTPPGSEEHPDGIPQSPFLEQERRTFYVALTRASERVVLERPRGTSSSFHQELGGARSAPGTRPAAPKPEAPVNQGRPWTEAEDDVLGEAWDRGEGLRDLAARFGRSTSAVAARLVRLGVVATRDEARRRGLSG